jgi:hypothetical protein
VYALGFWRWQEWLRVSHAWINENYTKMARVAWMGVQEGLAMLAYESPNTDGLFQEFRSPKVPMTREIMASFAVMAREMLFATCHLTAEEREVPWMRS